MNAQMVRTTVYLDKDLVSLAKMEALRKGASMTELVARGLKSELGIKKDQKIIRATKFRLNTHDFGGYVFRREDAYED